MCNIINQHSKTINQQSKNLLWLNLRELPFFRSLMRAVEASFYASVDLPSPILDIGCGDGQFVTVAFDRKIDVGLDPSSASLHEASYRNGYRVLVQAYGDQAPFPDGYFSSAFSNSVLEHIPDLEPVLAEANRLLKPGATFVFCVPNHQFLAALSAGRFMDRIHLKGLGNTYRRFFNRISRHYHSDPPDIWQQRLEKAGFEVVRWWHYYPPSALHITEWGHYLGLPSLIIHKLTGRWILSPTHWNLGLIYRYLLPRFSQSFESPDGVCTFYITRRKVSDAGV